jgi:catechol 2,3-dioxygenase-like lactoylglutathione lyase family enzyme
MAINRIVANIATEQINSAKAFYGEVLGMTVGMDHGWIITFVGEGHASPQISFASEGGSGTPVPDLSIEVDDLNMVHERMVSAGYQPEYGPVTEPWGVRRFFVRDPFGRLLNILSHA